MERPLEQKPKITVVIPVYNGERYIDGLLECFRQQEPGFLLLFVNDGSTDATQERLERAKREERFPIEILTQENAGVSAARNRGMQHTKTPYLLFFDVDDILHKDTLHDLYGLIERQNEPMPILFESTRVEEQYIHDGKIIVNKISVVSGQDDEDAPEHPEGESLTGTQMLWRLLLNPTRYGVINVLLPASIYTDASMQFAVGYKYYEDYHFLYRLFARCPKVYDMNQVYYYYVNRPGSAVNRFVPQRINDLTLIESLEDSLSDTAPEFYEHFHEWGVARLIWSVVWQGSVALDSKGFSKLCQCVKAREAFKKLRRFPDARVRCSAKLFLVCPRLYRFAVRILSRKKTKIVPISWSEIEGKVTCR